MFCISLLIFLSTIKVNPLKESLNCWTRIVGKKELKPFLFNNCLDLFNANGVKTVENKIYIDKIRTDISKKILTNFNFLTPDVHNIINSFSWFCLTMKTNNDNKNDSGINLVKIPSIF